jgi:hypothetical protein
MSWGLLGLHVYLAVRAPISSLACPQTLADLFVLPACASTHACAAPADVKPGQGLYRSQALDGTTTWFAKNCDANSYGVKSVLYGRVVMPCRECPAGMVTSKDAATFPNSASHYADNGDGTGGFTDPRACVSQAGWGYSGRSASRCAQVGVSVCVCVCGWAVCLVLSSAQFCFGPLCCA